MNILLDRLHQKILNNDSLMKEVTEGELLALVEVKEKQMPKKPYILQIEIDYHEHDCMKCPSCNSFLRYASERETEHYQCNYCPNCGQRLEW